MGKKLRVFTYDISDDKVRLRIAKRLEAVATRVQYSVFEGWFTDAALETLLGKISDELEHGGSLRVYSIGKTTEPKCSVIGQGIPIDTTTGHWIF